MDSEVDLLVVGGGINGAGIARDAAGRGLKVLLCEQHDLAQHTSSASSKLVHGGLRYLEQFEFRLVAESLGEREVLLRAAPHIVHPKRFVMPHVPELRPAWVIRAGLFLYDYLARRDTLQGSHGIDLRLAPYNDGLKTGLTQGFIYSDCWVDDARLVILNARAAADLGAMVRTRTTCVAARREGGRWRVTLQPENAAPVAVTSRALVNVTGPWAKSFLQKNLDLDTTFGLKLVKGSHIVVPRLYRGEHAFILQNDDKRVVFVYPYEEHYTLIGTTDVEYHGEPGECAASPAETDYLCHAANRYFMRAITAEDVVWHYCGIRPLFDDGEKNVSKITRDYSLRVDVDRDLNNAPLLSVFGGKITTYRRLAEHAVEKLADWFPQMKPPWTESASLPGGDFRGLSPPAFLQQLQDAFPALPHALIKSIADRHGANAYTVLGNAKQIDDMGQYFGGYLYAREVDYLAMHEWAHTAEDILWRRTKAGLHANAAEKERLQSYMMNRVVPAVR
jgi:glycerol-3-phosphate dehydrogenase